MWRPLLILAALAVTTPALADPCTAPVSGYHAGDVLTGTLRYVGDGDSACLSRSPDPSTWVEIRLADWFAPELHEPGGQAAKAALVRYLGQPIVCTVRRGQNGSTRSYDRVIAVCSIRGRGVGELMKAAGVAQGGKGWR